MEEKVDHDMLDAALKRCGASWDAAQTHGLLAGRLAVAGAPAGPDWLLHVLEGTDESDAFRGECLKMLDTLYQSTFWQLSERLSEFVPLLPGDDSDAGIRTMALAHWSEGFLHGLVSAQHGDELRDRLAAEPLADIIRDILQITRAEVDDATDEETNESAYTELVEYLRVAAQLAYEELSPIRHAHGKSPQDRTDTMH
ncbi:MAG: YecA family protein [Woeseiaceae bacterium]